MQVGQVRSIMKNPCWVRTLPCPAQVAQRFLLVPGVALLSTDSLLLPRFPGFAPGATGDLLFEQHLGGGALLLVAEIVGLPVLAAVLLEWVRADRTEAAVVDRLADEAHSDDDDAPGLWWETDPRFTDRRRPTQQP